MLTNDELDALTECRAACLAYKKAKENFQTIASDFGARGIQTDKVGGKSSDQQTLDSMIIRRDKAREIMEKAQERYALAMKIVDGITAKMQDEFEFELCNFVWLYYQQAFSIRQCAEMLGKTRQTMYNCKNRIFTVV